jgi:uncharacterized protein (DUF1778 family)
MQLAGVRIADHHVLRFSMMLRRADHRRAADQLEAAVATNQQTVSLTTDDQKAILSVLREPPEEPEELAALRAVLLLNERQEL